MEIESYETRLRTARPFAFNWQTGELANWKTGRKKPDTAQTLAK